MNDLMDTFEQLVLEEDELIKKIKIREGCISVVFDYILTQLSQHEIGKQALM